MSNKYLTAITGAFARLVALVAAWPKTATGLLLVLVLSLGVCLVADAQVASTRETAYDWACCEDQACVTRTVHQRFDTAFVACLNKSLADGLTRFVQGGRYRISAVPPPAPPADPPTDPPPPAGTGEASLSWNPPTTRTDGTPLTNLAGYRISYGTSPAADQLVVDVDQPGARSHTVSGLTTPGTWYFAIASYDSANIESVRSAAVSKTFP